MIRHLFSPRTLLPLALALTTTGVASAQGLFAGSKGARVAGRGGAYGAKADDLAAVEYNPAGLTRLGTTTLQLSNRFSYNMVSYQRSPATFDAALDTTGITPDLYAERVHFDEVRNQKPWQALDPLLGVGSNFGTDDFAAALVAYAPPGAARMAFPVGDATAPMGQTDTCTANPSAEICSYDYRSTGGQRYMMVEREAEILIYALSAAYKYKEVFGVGATAQWIHVPRLNYSLVVAPILFGNGGDPVRAGLDMLTEIEASAPFTFNAILGAWVRPAPSVEIALSGQVIPSRINAKGTIDITPTNGGTQLETYRQQGNTLEQQPGDDVELSIPLPMWARLALRYFKEDAGELDYDIELDVTYHTWSRVKAFNLKSDGLIAALPQDSLEIGDVDVQKSWKNGLTVQLGGDYSLLPNKLTLRAGAGFETAIADPAYAQVDFPTGHHISGALGGSVFFGGAEIALAYTYRKQLTVQNDSGKIYQVTPGTKCTPPYQNDPNALAPVCPVPGQPSPTVNNGRYNAQNHFLNLDVLYRF